MRSGRGYTLMMIGMMGMMMIDGNWDDDHDHDDGDDDEDDGNGDDDDDE